MLYSTDIHVLQLWLFQISMGLGEEFPVLLKRTFEVILPFQNMDLCEARLSSMMTTKQNINLNYSQMITWDQLFQPLFLESQILMDTVHRKQAQKSHWVTDWLKLFAIFQKKKIKSPRSADDNLFYKYGSCYKVPVDLHIWKLISPPPVTWQ